MANDDDYLARELVQIVVGVLGVHQVATLSSEVIGDLVHHVKQFIETTTSEAQESSSWGERLAIVRSSAAAAADRLAK